MLKLILAWLINSNGAKTAGAAVAGSGITVAMLIGLLEKNVDQKIESVNARVMHYVDRRHDQVSIDIKYIRENQVEIKELVKIINQRVYELNQKQRSQ